MSATSQIPSAVAERYAAAIFSLAAEQSTIDAVVGEFHQVVEAVSAHEGAMAALKNPLVTRAQKAALLEAVAAGASPLVRQALGMIARAGRAQVLSAISGALGRRLRVHRGEVLAQVVSARPLASPALESLAASLSKSQGKTVRLEPSVNPALLGGMTVQIGSRYLDASLAGALLRARDALLASPSSH